MIRDQDLLVDADSAGMRLDVFIVRRFPDSPRGLVSEAITRGDVTLNGRRGDKGATLRDGDTVRIDCLPEREDVRVQPNPDILLDVVYEDAALVAVNKPANMAVHPLTFRETGTLASGLVARYPETRNLGDQPLFPAFVHRIDTDTSGLVVAARSVDAYMALRRQFQERGVRKLYTALVYGRVKEDGAVDCPLAHHPQHPGRMIVVTNARRARVSRPMRAVSRYRVLERFPGFSLLEVEIETGVTHQIRCQLASVGHAVAGDKVYATPAERRAGGPARQFLHAARLELSHPTTSDRLTLEAPLAPDLVSFVQDLRRS